MNAYYLMAGSLLTATTGFAFWIIAARFYSTEDVGIASATISAMSLLANFSTLGLAFGLIRFLPGAGDKSIKMVNSCFAIAALVSLATGVIFVAGLPIWSPRLGAMRAHPIYIASFIIFTLLYTMSFIADAVFIAERKAKFNFLKNAAAAVIKIPLPIALATAFGAFGIFASEGLAIAAALGLALFWLLPRLLKGYFPLPTLDRSVISEMLRYSLGTYVANTLWLAPTYLLPLLVVNVLNSKTNAYFYIAWAIAGIATQAVPNAMSSSLFAEGSHDQSRLGRNTRRTLEASLLILGLVIALTFALGGRVLLLFGRQYSENATTLLWVLSISAIPLTINYIFLTLHRVRKEIPMLIVVSTGATGLSLGLIYILMRELGLIGVGIGWTLGQSIVAAIVVVPLLRQSRFSHKVTNE